MQLNPSLSSDHKNLANLQTAKTLNAGQARWALFFTRFQFSISYRPGSHNFKPDALSRQYSGSEDKTNLVPILPATCTVAVIPWEKRRQFRRLRKWNPTLEEGQPGGYLFPILLGLKFCIGPILLVSPATQEYTELLGFCNATSGGHLSLGMLKNRSPPIQSAPGINPQVSRLQDNSILCLHSPDRGPISHLIL